MIEYIKGDITEVKAPAYIMHGVNCQGKMGSGVAKALYTKWPKVKESYLRECPEPDELKLGYSQQVFVAPSTWVINCFTQVNYGYDGKKYASLKAIDRCIWQALSEVQTLLFDPVISMPKIGCGLGGLSWEEEVLPVIQERRNEYWCNHVKIRVYEL